MIDIYFLNSDLVRQAVKTIGIEQVADVITRREYIVCALTIVNLFPHKERY